MNNPLSGATALLCALLTLGGCTNTLQPLDYHANQSYVPLTLGLDPVRSRIDENQQTQTINALKHTGAFSMLDGGWSKSGYGLLITEPKGPVNVLGMLNILTLLTFPMPCPYEDYLRGTVYKDGRLLKTYSYSREGWSICAWYVPIPSYENKRQMLDQLLMDIEKDKLIPYQP